MPTVEFNLADGSPRVSRTAGVPTFAACTIVLECAITSYENFADLVAITGTTNEYLLLEAAADGSLYITTQDDGAANNTSNLWTDTYTGRFWVALVCNGTTVQTYYQRFGGSFTTSTSLTLTGMAFTPDSIIYGAAENFLTDSEGTFNYGAIKEFAAALTSSEIQQEFTQRMAVRTLNLTFANDCHNATGNNAVNINQTGGTNGTLTGTPTTLTTGQPGAPWRRSRVRAVLAAAASSFSGDGSAALSAYACSGVGAVSIAGTGTAALSAFAAAALGTFAIPAPMAQPQPLSRLYYPARLPIGYLPQLGRGILLTGAQRHEGSASAAFTPFACSGSGVITFSGSGSAALSSFACSGAGGETLSGSGSAACQPFAAAATGGVGDAVTGTGTCAFSPFAATASGTETYTGSGSAAASPFACSGSATGTLTGSGSATFSEFACTGNGAQGDVFAGSGSAVFASFAATSDGDESFSASGSATCEAFAASATGLESYLASGDATFSPFAASAVGLHIQPITGSGSAALAEFAAAASGQMAAPVTGSGSVEISSFAALGTGGNAEFIGPVILGSWIGIRARPFEMTWPDFED